MPKSWPYGRTRYARAMNGRVINFAAYCAKRSCRRADGSLPEVAPKPVKDARLAKALAAVAALHGVAFERKVEIFRRAWLEGHGRQQGDSTRRGSG